MENNKLDVIDWLNDIMNNDDWLWYYSNSEVRLLAADALELLKAQEPRFVPDIAEAILGHRPKVKVGHCPSCGVLMSETDNFCRKCGQAVKWE